MDPASLYDDAYRRNPLPVWAELRDEHPLFHDTRADVWWLSRYDDVAAVFADHQTYSASTYEESTGQVVGPTLISRDDHGHVTRRAIVAPDFVGKRLDGYRPMITDAANTLIDRFGETGDIDLVADFSSQLPVDVIAAMLGMEGDGARFRSWVTDMIRGLARVEPLRQRGVDAHAEFCAHIRPMLDGVEGHDRTDHIAKIARAEVDGERLDAEEITAFCGLLFIAGGETTDKAIANLWHNMLARPDLYQEACNDRSLWDPAFSEMMRHTPPVVSEDRYTTAPVEWHGVELPVGSRVRVSIGAAHRDPTVFADPDLFDPRRTDLHLATELRSGGSTEQGRSAHLGFGLGKHFCIGYQLARAEALIGTNLLLDRCGPLALADGAEPYVVIEGNAFQSARDLRLRRTGQTAVR